MEDRHGYCKCGCGELTPIRKYGRSGLKKGVPSDFLQGHQQRLKTKPGTCSVEGCDNKVKARGMCNGHYLRKWHAGNLFSTEPVKRGRNDLSGQKFNRLKVLKLAYIDKSSASVWECICDCGSIRLVRGNNLRSGETKSCGCWGRDYCKTRVGAKSHNWKGGFTTMHGYRLVRGYGHPNSLKDGYVLEHRKIMSDHIGRPLESYEKVHHKNQIKDDNRVENLVLLTHTTHIEEIKCPHCLKMFVIQ